MSLIYKIKVAQKLKCEQVSELEAAYKSKKRIKQAFDDSLTRFVEDRFITKYSTDTNIDSKNLLVLSNESFDFQRNSTSGLVLPKLKDFITEANYSYCSKPEVTIKMMIDLWIKDNKQYIVEAYKINTVNDVIFHIKYINPDYIDS